MSIGQNVLVALFVATVSLACSSTSHAFFEDDFDTANDWFNGGVGTSLRNANGWVRGGFGGFIRNDGEISPNGFGGTQGAGPAGTFGHAFRNISGDLNGDSYLWQVDVNAPGMVLPGGAGINVGDPNTVLFPNGNVDDATNANHLTFEAVSQPGANRFAFGVMQNGIIVEGSNGGVSPVSISALGWFQMKIEGDSTSATAEYRDINDVTGLPIEEAWNLINTYTTIPFNVAGAAGIRMIGDAVIDNVVSGDNSIPPTPPTDFTWTLDDSGAWETSSNWDKFEVPNNGQHSATFGGAINAPRTVTVDSAISVRSIAFNNSNTYAIAGTGSLNLETSSVEVLPTINSMQGTHQFQAIVNLRNHTTVDIASGSKLSFNNELNLMGNTLTKTGDGELAVRNDLNTAGGTIDVKSGVLSGNGTIGGDVNNEGGILSPGNNPGVIANGRISDVPEPATWLLLAIGWMAWSFANCRRE